MLLNGLDKLLARLCLKIGPSQLEKLLSCSRLSPSVKSNIRHSNIKYLKGLKKISPSIQQFLATLKECLETLDDSHDLLELLERFRRVYPRLEVLEQDPGVIVTRCVASDKQKGAFSRVLVKISNELKDDDLEILVALCPTPEGRKDALISGVKLFDELQCHGCITEDNTDLLEDLFRVLKLAKPAALLAEYRTAYPLAPSSAGALERQMSFGSGDLPLLHIPSQPAQVEPRMSRPPRGPHPPHSFSTPHQESSPLVQTPLTQGTTTTRTGRPVNSPQKTPTPTNGDQRPFHAHYAMDPVYPRPHNGAGGSLRSVRGSGKSIYPPPVSEAPPSAPPIQHVHVHQSSLSSYTAANSRELFEVPVRVSNEPQFPVNKGPPTAPHIHKSTSSSLSSYTAANSRELFPVPVRVSNEPQLMSGAAKGTLGASKFPNKELNKYPGTLSSRELTNQFQTVAPVLNNAPALNNLQPESSNHTPGSTDESYEHESNFHSAEDRLCTGDLNEVVVAPIKIGHVNTGSGSTLESYRHDSNFDSAEDRQRSGGMIEVAVGNKTPNAQNSHTSAVVCEERSSTVPVSEVMLIMRKGSSLPVLSRSQVQGDEENIPSVNVAVTPLKSQETNRASYHSPPSPVMTTRVPDVPSSPVGEEISRKRSHEDDEEMVVNKRRRSSRIPAKKKSFLKWFGEKLGLSSVKEEESTD